MSHRGGRASGAHAADPGDRTRSGGAWTVTIGTDSWRGLLLDSLVMESRDRLGNLGLLGGAGVVWLLTGVVMTTRDPVLDPAGGLLGAALIGLALALTAIPLLWLAVFARNRRIAYTGDWPRAVRRGAWIGLVAAFLVVLRLQGVFEPAIALFVIAMVVVAEATLSVER
jgi:hypothetical protein